MSRTCFLGCLLTGNEQIAFRIEDKTSKHHFEHKLIIHGTKRTVELLPLTGHTASDVILYLPEEKIAFMGDLLFVNMHPYLASGSPEQWKQSLAEAEALGAQIVVPGQWPCGSIDRPFGNVSIYSVT